jgi:alkaline phosphatase D
VAVAVGAGPAPAGESTAVEHLAESRQATGIKIGEVTEASAVVWTRVTERESRRADGEVRRGHGRPSGGRKPPDPRDLEGSVPGAPGRVRLFYGTDEAAVRAATGAGDGVRLIDWQSVSADDDFTHRFRLEGLAPGTGYFLKTETSDPDSSVIHAPLTASFQTAPPADRPAAVTFTVTTCQAYRHTDSPEGFATYDAMARLAPDFTVATGDSVYYDTDDPRATTLELARYHWHRMYSLPSLLAFHRRVPVFWEKDDHDTYRNDAWPGMRAGMMGAFSFEQGGRVFREQVPAAEVPYRTVRWGKLVEVWLTEVRDYRSPNTMPDGPDKTVWGAEQKAWLERSLVASDADWKVLVNPTPIVGPDRQEKNDNHANEGFAHEGGEIRAFFHDRLPESFFVVAGDRHWQYHSVHPVSRVQELGTGPVSDAHASGSPGEDPRYHLFHRVAGGFLSVEARRDGADTRITLRLHRVDGSVVYEYTRARPVGQEAGRGEAEERAEAG